MNLASFQSTVSSLNNDLVTFQSSMSDALKAVGVPDSSADSVTASGFVAAPKKDCQSTFEVTDCYGGVQARSLKVSAPPSNGGLACLTGDVSVLACRQSL